MGVIYSYFWGPAEPLNFDVPDGATGLTPREKKFVTDSWSLAQKSSKEVGIELFVRFFKKYPEYHAMFSSLKDIPISEIRDHKRLHAHSNTVMYSLSSVVNNLDDPGCLVEILKKLGENHKRHRVPKKSFTDLKAILLELLNDMLGAAVMTPQAVEAWSKTIDVAYKFIFEGLS